MIMEWLGAIQWDQPAIVGPVAAALTAGVFAIVLQVMKPKKPSSPSVKVVLPDKNVGQEVSKAVVPLRQDIEALREQLATAQLAPKQAVPDSEDPLKVKAVEFFNAGVDAYNKAEIGQALGHWLDAVKLAPDSARAHYNLGIALQAKGELDAAIEHWSAALRIVPDYAAAHYNLGVALQSKGELDAPIEHYNAALRIDPDHAKAHNNLGVALKAQGEVDAAIEHYNAALRIEPDDAVLHLNLGRALAQKKAAGEAVAALARAIELDQRNRAGARNDPDYDPIRADPAFRKLVYGE